MSDTPTAPVCETIRPDVLNRLRRIEGQVRGVQRMVEDERDCRDVVIQLAAIKSAVGSLSSLVAEAHARKCLLNGEVMDPEELNRVLDLLKNAR